MSGHKPPHLPKYRHYKPKNLAVVRFDGKDIYLGKYDSDESKEKYARLIAERFGRSHEGPPTRHSNESDLTIDELILRYWTEHVEVYHIKDGKPTDRQHHIRLAFRPLRRLYDSGLARDIGPKALQLVRDEMIRDGLERRGRINRSYVNDHIGITKRLFRWAVAQELIGPQVHQALEAVESIHKGRDPRVSESEKIRPAPRKHVQAILRFVSPQIRAMIQLQRLTAMRPDEVTIMRPADIDRSGDVWIFTPDGHKTEHLGIEKTVPLGFRAQTILRPWLDREPGYYLFSPREVVAARNNDRRSAATRRKRRQKRTARRQPRDHYDDESYCQAVVRACKKAGVPKWTPGQLRRNRSRGVG